MTEERFQRLETLSEEHTQQIRGIYAALNEISQTMRAFAQGITELREQQSQFAIGLAELRQGLAELRQGLAELRQGLAELRQSQQSVIETQRSVMGNVEQLSNIVNVLATEAAEDRAVMREMQAEIRQIWQYLLNQRGNGRSE